MENIKQDEVLEEENSVRFKTEAEKAKEIKYNSDGERLVYMGNDCWVPEKAVPTEQDIHEYYARFAHPRFYPLAMIWNLLIPVILSLGTAVLLKYAFAVEWFQSTEHMIWATLTGIGAYALLHTRHLIVFGVKLYQRFSPMHVRERCVFTPTCSDYTIISLQKYGLIIGGIRSIRRLQRCNYDHGGYDYP